MKIYFALCRNCSSPNNPEFREHIENDNTLTCQYCGFELKAIPLKDKGYERFYYLKGVENGN